jgi:hypothetical protein
MKDWLIYRGLWPGTSRAAFRSHQQDLRRDRDAAMDGIFRDPSLSAEEAHAKAKAIYAIYEGDPDRSARRQKRWAQFVLLAVYGIMIWGTADESRHLAEWRQWLLFAFWTVIAFVLLALLDD